jgi:hypothetical protein
LSVVVIVVAVAVAVVAKNNTKHASMSTAKKLMRRSLD